MRAAVVRKVDGFTLVELVIIIVTLGILAAVAVPKFVDLADNSKVTATRDEMNRLKRAIAGNPSAIVAGAYIDRGFEGDVGHVPQSLSDLAAKPDSLSAYDPVSSLGWNGPYIDSSGGQYLTDAWGNVYTYEPSNRLILSPGAGGNDDTLVVRF